MPARKNQHVAFDGPDATENTIGASANLFRRFSVGTTVAKQLPVGSLRVNLDGSKTFIIAVVPFDQIGIDLGCRAEARWFTRSNGALQRTGEHFGENQSSQALPQPLGVEFAATGQRQIGKPRMLARDAPGGFAMARQIDYGKNFGRHGWSTDRPLRVAFIKCSPASCGLPNADRASKKM